MNVTTLHDLLDRWEIEHQAERDATQVTPSATNTLCRRQLAYRLTLTPESDERDRVSVATIGSLIHAGIALLWQREPDTETEVPCDGGGTADVVQDSIIRDTKTVGRAKYNRWERNGGPPDEVWDQGHTYAGRLGAEQGTTVVIDAICRETGRCATYQQPYDPDRWQAAEDGLANLQHRYGEGDPHLAPADRDGHGDWVCDSCPWATVCLGPDERPNNSDLPEEEVIIAAAQYAEWNAIANEAKAKAKAAQNLLRGSEGTFGGWQIKWREVAGTRIEAYDRRGFKTLTVKEVQQ